MGRQRKIAPGIGERLLEVINSEESLEIASEKLKTPINTINNYLRGDREPSYSFLLKLKNIANVDLNWLMTGEITPQIGANKPQKENSVFSIPRYVIRDNMGLPFFEPSDNQDDGLMISQELLKKIVPVDGVPGAVVADGDSMDPTFRKGDLLIANFNIKHNRLSSGGIYIADHGGNVFIRRLQRMSDGHVEILPDNQHYKSENLSPEEVQANLKIHGEIIWVGAPLRNR